MDERSRLLLSLAVVIVAVPAAVIACKKTSVGTRASCEELRLAAGASAYSVVSAAASSCITASDCVEIDSLSCTGSGCAGYAVASKASGSAAAQIAKINGNQCKEWRDHDCAKTDPLPMASCASPRLACRKNRCEWRYPFETLSADQCNALIADADKEISEVLSKRNVICWGDSDCAVVSEHACFADCGGRAIGRDSFAAYEAAKTRALNDQCSKWQDGDCMTTTPRASPSCVPLKVKCEKGKLPPNIEVTPPGACVVQR